MTLRELSYSLLEIIRNSHVVDDERVDARLLDNFIVTKRAELISTDNKVDAHNESLRQTMWVDLSLDSSGHNPSILKSTTNLPVFIENRYGPLIDEIRGNNHMAYPFTVVPFDRLRWCGSGRFNQDNIFVSIHGKRLFLRSRDDSFRMISKAKIEGIFENPMEVLDDNGDPQITPSTGDFPINGELFNKIKDDILTRDIAFMLRLPSDEVSDATGDIK